MKDFLGNKLKVGDEVAYISGSYKEFGRGVIEKIGKKMLTIPRRPGAGDVQQYILRYPSQVIKAMDIKGLANYLFVEYMHHSLRAIEGDAYDNVLTHVALESTVPLMALEQFTGTVDPRSEKERDRLDAHVSALEGHGGDVQETKEALIAFYKKELAKCT